MDDIESFVRFERFRGLADDTIKMRRWLITRFQHWLNKPLLTATNHDIEAWLTALDIGPDARATYLKHLRAFYRWAVIHELIIKNPTAQIPIPRTPRRLPRPIPDHELRASLAVADDPTIIAWLYLGAYAGLRCHEIARIRNCDIVSNDGEAVLIVQGKGNKQRIVPLHPDVLCRLPRTRGHLFRHDGRPYTARQVSYRMARFFDQQGINATAHRLRHWFGTAVYSASKDLRLTQELMGHASPQTTAGYVAFSASEAAGVVRRLSV